MGTVTRWEYATTPSNRKERILPPPAGALMGWKFWNSKTLPASDSTTNQDAELAAFELVRMLVEGRPPFDRKTWLVAEIRADFAGAAERCIWAYQVNTYLDSVAAKFGHSAEELVRA